MCDVPSIAVFCGEFIEFSLIIIIIIITTIIILTSVHLLGVRTGLLLHLITHTRTLNSTPLDNGSAHLGSPT